jgi:hypothetical protein
MEDVQTLVNIIVVNFTRENLVSKVVVLSHGVVNDVATNANNLYFEAYC